MERYDISKNYPGGSKVIYNDQVYEAKWWANPGQTPAQKVEHEWDTPWKKIDSSIKAESEIPTPVISKPVVPKPEKMETKVEPTRIREALAPWPKKVFAPYTDSTLYPILKLSDIARATGVKYFILGFVVSKDGCNLSWGTYYDIEKGPSSWVESGEYYLYDELNKIRDLGGDFMVSIGGAINKPLAATCTNVDELVGKYHYLIDTLKLKALDFDIEG
ncbi:MAG: hypothetical protein Q8Q25_01470, partial [bacterium]|nr:hypothetical protein [bacterium]